MEVITKSMKVIIAGSRSFTDIERVFSELDSYHFWYFDITECVCGMANGVDIIGKEWCLTKNIPVKEFPADWDKHGKAAGPIRNKQMAEYSDCAIVIWDGKSKGSKNMIEQMKKAQKPVYEVII